MTVAALFVRPNTIYRDLGADCWDETRDARRYAGDSPVVAHPPCRSWGKLRTFAKPVPGEREMAHFAMDTVRRCGGVLEHPTGSQLWRESGAFAGHRDAVGGILLTIFQSWFGHRVPKPTGLYIVGVEPADLPPIPFELGTDPCRTT